MSLLLVASDVDVEAVPGAVAVEIPASALPVPVLFALTPKAARSLSARLMSCAIRAEREIRELRQAGRDPHPDMDVDTIPAVAGDRDEHAKPGTPGFDGDAASRAGERP